MSHASAALETNSRRKISRSEYKELMIKSITRPTSVVNLYRGQQTTRKIVRFLQSSNISKSTIIKIYTYSNVSASAVVDWRLNDDGVENAFFTTPNDDLRPTIDEVKALLAEAKASIAAAENFMVEEN